MRWRIRRISNGCAAQQLVARRDVLAPEFISYGLVIRGINRKLCLKRANEPHQPGLTIPLRCIASRLCGAAGRPQAVGLPGGGEEL